MTYANRHNLRQVSAVIPKEDFAALQRDAARLRKSMQQYFRELLGRRLAEIRSGKTGEERE